ncbi:hypothetical protein ACNKHQ_03545 [Shigella flexneri]
MLSAAISESNGGQTPQGTWSEKVEERCPAWLATLVVAEGARVFGVISLKAIVKGGRKERFAGCRQWVSRR